MQQPYLSLFSAFNTASVRPTAAQKAGDYSDPWRRVKGAQQKSHPQNRPFRRRPAARPGQLNGHSLYLAVISRPAALSCRGSRALPSPGSVNNLPCISSCHCWRNRQLAGASAVTTESVALSQHLILPLLAQSSVGRSIRRHNRVGCPVSSDSRSAKAISVLRAPAAAPAFPGSDPSR